MNNFALNELPKFYITSDWHFCHDREFVWGVRGFDCVNDMNEYIINAHNSIVKPEDDVYVLGDLMLGDSKKGIECIKRLNGKLHIVYGNHDTDARKKMYSELPNVVEAGYVLFKKWGKYSFYMSHYPTLTGNFDQKHLSQMVLNLFGHTHQSTNFYMDMPYMYHVGVDSHNCFPCNINDIITEMKNKVKECEKFLEENQKDEELHTVMVEREKEKSKEII